MSLQTAFQTMADNGIGPAQFSTWMAQGNDAYHQNPSTDINVVAQAAYNVWGATAGKNDLADFIAAFTSPSTNEQVFTLSQVDNALDSLYNGSGGSNNNNGSSTGDLKTALQKVKSDGYGPAQFSDWMTKSNTAFQQHPSTDVDAVANTVYQVWSTEDRNNLQTLVASFIDPATQRNAFTFLQVENAFAKIYGAPKFSITVQANQKWQNSQIVVESGITVSVLYQSGTWTANPATGMVDANGNSTYVAKPGYTLPGAYEGALIGRVINNGTPSTPFLIGNSLTIPQELNGYLEFCINDDLSQQYGMGFADNQGAITLQVTSSKFAPSDPAKQTTAA